MGKLTILALCAAALGVIGCGSGGGKPAKTSTSGGPVNTAPSVDSAATSPAVVIDAAISAQPADSPQRALLTWWQALQFQDYVTAASITTPRASATLPRGGYRQAVIALQGGLPGIKIVGVKPHQQSTSVRALMLFFTGSPPKLSAAQPLSFVMARSVGGWRVDDLAYLRKLAPKSGR